MDGSIVGQAHTALVVHRSAAGERMVEDRVAVIDR